MQQQGCLTTDESKFRPGDLVFYAKKDNSLRSDGVWVWHVAVYIGNGRIIHAPSKGQPVQEAATNPWPKSFKIVGGGTPRQ